MVLRCFRGGRAAGTSTDGHPAKAGQADGGRGVLNREWIPTPVGVGTGVRDGWEMGAEIGKRGAFWCFGGGEGLILLWRLWRTRRERFFGGEGR